MKYTATWREVTDHTDDFDLDDHSLLKQQVDDLTDESHPYSEMQAEYLYRVTDQWGRIWYDADSDEHGSSYENPPCAKCSQPLRDATPDTWECDHCGRVVTIGLWVVEQGNNPEDPECPHCGEPIDNSGIDPDGWDSAERIDDDDELRECFRCGGRFWEHDVYGTGPR